MDTATVERLSGALRSGAGVSETTRHTIERWLSDPNYEVFRPEVAALIEAGQWSELEDAFYTQLTVGTGGIRGRVGPGTNRINLRTIGEAAQALSRFISEYGEEHKKAGVVVGHEARRQSVEFARLCCEIFAANGIRSYLLDGLRATPEISFAVRHLKTTAGVQITASHNPRTDNGFKFYWSDGGQVVPPHDARFMQLVKEVSEIQRMPFDTACADGLVTIVGADVDREYLTAVRTLSVDKSRSAKIVFSPIHGAGSTNVLPVLQSEGFDVTIVPEQAEPDAEFPTAVGDLINPEFREVMELPIGLAERVGADLAICSDPDADRIGVAARKRLDGTEVEFLTGNQVGIALTQYILERRHSRGSLAPNHLVIETCVTSTLIADVAESFGLKPLSDLFVGYKFIAQEIAKLEDPTDFVFSAEESLGYLAGTFVRDKDAAIAALLVAEMASWLKDRGMTVPQYLDSIYQRLGYYKNLQYLVELPGRSGRDIMEQVMLHLRARTPKALAGAAVRNVVDWLDPAASAPGSYKMGGSADMLSYVLSDDGKTRVTMRPSGTEPKLKYYIQCRADVDGSLDAVKARVDTLANDIAKAVGDWSGEGLSPDHRREWDGAIQRLV